METGGAPEKLFVAWHSPHAASTPVADASAGCAGSLQVHVHHHVVAGHPLDGPGLGKLQGRDPVLPLDLRGRPEVVGLRAARVGDDEVARVFCDDVSPVEGDGAAAGAGHLALVAVVVEQSVGQHEPSLLITLQKT